MSCLKACLVSPCWCLRKREILRDATRCKRGEVRETRSVPRGWRHTSAFCAGRVARLGGAPLDGDATVLDGDAVCFCFCSAFDGPDWFKPTKKHRGALADWLRQRSVSSITVDDERSIPASKFSADARGKAGGPTVVQLKQAVWEHLAAHPEIDTTVPQQLMSDAGYELLYTPPYVSDLQPIEMI